jgi:signal transduction histidine kinase
VNALIYMLCSVFCAAWTVRAWTKGPWDPVRRAFVVIGMLATLSFGGFTLYLVPGFVSMKYLHSGAGAFLPAAILSFLAQVFPEGRDRARSMAGRLWALTPFVVLAFILADVFLYSHIPRASAAEVIVALYALASFSLCLQHLWVVHGATELGVVRGRIRYLAALLGATVLLSAIEQLTRSLAPITDTADLSVMARSFVLQGAFPPIGAVVGTLFIYFLYQVVERARLLDLTEIFARLFTLVIAALILVIMYGLTALWVGSQGWYPVHETFLVFLASTLFLSFYEPLQTRLDVLAGEWFNRPGRQLEISLAEATRGMAKAISMEGLEVELLGRLHQSGRAQLTSLYLWDQDRGTFRLTLSRGQPSSPLMQNIAGEPFTDAFSDTRRVYIRADLARIVRQKLPSHEDAADILRTMGAMDTDITIAIRSGDRVLGWLNVKDEDWSDGFSRDEIRRMVATVDRVAILLANIHGFKQLEEQHRLAALGTMAAGMAHEIRNPLAGIKGAAQFLQGDVKPEEIKEFLGVIIEEANRLDEVVNQFLDFSRHQDIDIQAGDVNILVQRVLEFIEKMEELPIGVRFETQLAADLPHAQMDPDKVRQVLLNLVLNGVQAAGRDAHIRIRTGRGRLVRQPNPGAPAIEISVRDNGPGISPEDVTKLFIPFFTTKRDGTGLGLSISRRLVEAHGGELVVRSRPGRGSTFTIRIPVGLELEDPETEEIPLPMATPIAPSKAN